MESTLYLPEFTQPSVETYLKLFGDKSATINLRGGGLNDILIYRPETRRGGSLFGFLKRAIIPLLKPALLSFGTNVLGDLNQGKGLKSTLKNRGVESIANLGKRVVSGGGRPRKRKQNKKKKRVSKRFKYDIFNE